MKTTIDITTTLYEEARQVAQEEHTTIRILVEEGLRRTLAERKRRAPFVLRDSVFNGEGLQPQFSGSSWDQIRAAAYEGHGG